MHKDIVFISIWMILAKNIIIRINKRLIHQTDFLLFNIKRKKHVEKHVAYSRKARRKYIIKRHNYYQSIFYRMRHIRLFLWHLGGARVPYSRFVLLIALIPKNICTRHWYSSVSRIILLTWFFCQCNSIIHKHV